MSKLNVTVNKDGSEKEYIFEYTRDSICKAEETFGISLQKVTSELDNYTELNTFLKVLAYAGLIKHQPELTRLTVGDVYEELTGDGGYEEEAFVEGLAGMLGDALNPKGGGRKKTFPKIGK